MAFFFSIFKYVMINQINIDYPNSKFYESYQMYKYLLIKNPNTELTPAYDLKAVYSAVTGITEYKTVEEIMYIENLNEKYISDYLLFIIPFMCLLVTYLII